jgi:hypothetical protein
MTNGTNAHAPVKSNAVKKHFYENCSEDDLIMENRMDGGLNSVLKLHFHCPLMMTKNSEVGNGQANGGRGCCVSTREVEGWRRSVFSEAEMWCDCFRCVCVLQVDSFVAKHLVNDITPCMFEVQSASGKFNVGMKIRHESNKVKMAEQQFPLLSNSCTAGHKL